MEPGSRFNALTGLSCYQTPCAAWWTNMCFNALTGLSCYAHLVRLECCRWMFQCPHGLELLPRPGPVLQPLYCFNALTGLSCYIFTPAREQQTWRFNALTGLSCYGKNTQYFKFFMILFMHTCYL